MRAQLGQLARVVQLQNQVVAEYHRQAAEMAEWQIDLKSGLIQRSEQHDRIYGYDKLLPEFTRETFFRHLLPADMPTISSLVG